MAFGKKTDRAGLQAVLELKNVDYSKDPEIQQLYTRLVNGRSQFGQILAKNASASLQIAEVVDALKDYNSKMESVSQQIAQASEDATQSASESSDKIVHHTTGIFGFLRRSAGESQQRCEHQSQQTACEIACVHRSQSIPSD